MRLGLEFPGLNRSYYLPTEELSIDGDVFVERAAPKQLDLVDREGQRVSLSVNGSTAVSFEGIAAGTRFWLSARERFYKSNPYARPQVSLAFSLRTEEGGPVLLATLEGDLDESHESLGLPISIRLSCTTETAPLPSTAPDCFRRVEVFEALIDAAVAVRVAPGAGVTTRIDGTSYGVTLAYASYETYSADADHCVPADFAPHLALDLDVVSEKWHLLAAEQPVELTELPECRLGTDAPLVDVDVEQLEWDQLADGNAELSLALAASDDAALEFSTDVGVLRVTGDPAALTVLERAAWVSIDHYYTLVFREAPDGDALVAHSKTTVEEITAFARRPDVLGSDIELEPRCDWLSDVCPAGASVFDDRTGDMALYDVVYGAGTDDTRLAPSHERATVSAGPRKFDAWVAVSPSCDPDPPATATFVARDE